MLFKQSPFRTANLALVKSNNRASCIGDFGKPIIALHTTQEQIVLTEQSRHHGILFMKTFNADVVNSVIVLQKCVLRFSDY